MKPLPNTLQNAIANYWDVAYSEGQEQRTHDTAEGAAQKTLANLNEEIQKYAAAYLKDASNLSVDDLWNCDELMSLNAELGLTMEQLQKIAKIYKNLILKEN